MWPSLTLLNLWFKNESEILKKHIIGTPYCRSLLTGYFLASRRSRRGSDVPQAALATLLCLAVAHAKLALRQEAGEEDGVAACHFYETSLAAQLGHSLLEPPRFTSSSMVELVGSVAKKEMEMFHRF